MGVTRPGASRPARRSARGRRAGGRGAPATAREASISFARSIPVSIAHLVEHRDEVLGGDVAGRARRHRAAAELAERSTRSESMPCSSAASTLASPWPRVLWKWAVSSTPGRRSRAAAKNSPTWRGFAIPVVSPNATSSQPASASRSAISKHALRRHLALVRDSRTRSRSRPRSEAPPRAPRAIVRSQARERLGDRAVDVLAVVGLRRGEEEVDLVEAVAVGERALEPLLVRDQDRVARRPSGRSIASSTSSASASCGITSGRTNEVTSSRSQARSPRACRSAAPSRRSGSPRARSGTRRAARPRGSGRVCGSSVTARRLGERYRALSPPPTSITRRSWVPTPIVRSPSLTSTSKRSLRPSTTSRSVARTVQSAPSARRRDVLDADLEADRRLALGRFSKERTADVPLHHPDHPRRREDADADRAADVGDQAVLDHELVDRSIPARVPRRSRRHRSDLPRRSPPSQTIPRPPETPSVSPVT